MILDDIIQLEGKIELARNSSTTYYDEFIVYQEYIRKYEEKRRKKRDQKDLPTVQTKLIQRV